MFLAVEVNCLLQVAKCVDVLHKYALPGRRGLGHIEPLLTGVCLQHFEDFGFSHICVEEYVTDG